MPPCPSAAQPLVVVLTGGASRRMGSHKPALDVGGRPLVARVLAAAGAWPALVVGQGQGVPDGVPVLWERVPGGGPVAGLAVAVKAVSGASVADAVGADVVVVLAADLPFVTSEHVRRLVAALEVEPRADAAASLPDVPDAIGLAVTVDPDGRHNWLCSAWRTGFLAQRLGELGDPYGRSMRELADGVPTRLVDDPDRVALDVDTPADLERARERAG